MQTALRRTTETGNEKDPSAALGMTKRGKAYLTFFFNLWREPTSAPSGHLLPEEGGSVTPSRIVISSEREKSFSFAVRQKRRGEGERETPHSLRLGSTVFHAESFTKENGNGKRKRSLGCARDDETRAGLFPISFQLA